LAAAPTPPRAAAAAAAAADDDTSSSPPPQIPPDFFAQPTPSQSKKTFTSLSKRTAINSTHLIPFNITGGVFVERDVQVTNSTGVSLEPPPQVAARFNFSDNVQFRLNDTDALDVGDDEALDVMSNGKGKALAGELDGLSTVFPDGSVAQNAHGGGGGIKPASLSAALAVRAGFDVSATLGTTVALNDSTEVENSSDVTIAGLLLDVEAVALNNTQLISEDSDFADTADNGGTTVLQAGSGVALAGEVEELLPPHDPHGNGLEKTGGTGRGSSSSSSRSSRGGPGAAFGPRGASRRRRWQQQQQQQQQQRQPHQPTQGRLLRRLLAAVVAASADEADEVKEQGQEQRVEPQHPPLRLTMTVENNVTADGAVAVRDARGVRSEPVAIDIDLVVDGATQANGTSSSSSSSSSSWSSSSSSLVSSDDQGVGCGEGGGRALASSSSSSSSSPSSSSPSYITLVLNIFNRIYVDARRLVSGSTDVAVGPQTISVSVKVANVTQLDLGGGRGPEAAAAAAALRSALASAAATSPLLDNNSTTNNTNGAAASRCRRALRGAP
jgi:hypothetical protein